ncbi:MAG: carboxylating nicotinate-nucleotide diphosphorylase [Verrucomicrobiota bacterium]
MYDSTPSSELSPAVLREAASRALGEDLGPADLTSLATVPEDLTATAQIVTREPCVLAGLPVARQVFVEASLSMEMDDHARDGDRLEAGARILSVTGNARAILTAERTALNFLQQLSAVATKTRRYVDAVAGSGAKILDTRKTIPGLRVLQKYAVRCGGGHSHRWGLYDAFLIKDNHLALMGEPGNWAKAVATARELNPDVLLEVEADTVAQVRILAGLGVDRILLDNMSNEEMSQCVQLVADAAETEASGGMTLERVAEVAATGVDYISVGELTHSLRALDFSLEMAASA